MLPVALLAALAQGGEGQLAAPFWLPHTQQWITLRTAPGTHGHRWVY